MTSYTELLAHKAELEALIATAQAERKAEGIAAARALIAEHGLTAADVFPAQGKKAKGSVGAPKYRDHATGAPALEAPAAPAMPAPQFDLHKFYGVQNDMDLIAAQARHIEKLQAKLAPMPAAAIQRVREG